MHLVIPPILPSPAGVLPDACLRTVPSDPRGGPEVVDPVRVLPREEADLLAGL